MNKMRYLRGKRELQLLGKKKAYTALLRCRTFLCRKKWGPQRKDFGGGYVLPGFYRVFVSTTGLESFSLRPEKFSERSSFGGGCVRFFFSELYARKLAKTIVGSIVSRKPPIVSKKAASPSNGSEDQSTSRPTALESEGDSTN